MPNYDFECSDHGRFEEICPLAAPIAYCPTCGREARKLVTGCAINIPAYMKAEEDDTTEFFRDSFKTKVIRDGMTGEDMVKKGLATTADMSRWI